MLAGRVFSPDVLRRRADLLRLCGALPAGRRVVIETASDLPALSAEHLVEAAVAALQADPKLSVVVVTLDPTGQPPTEAPFRVPGVMCRARAHASRLGRARRHRGCDVRVCRCGRHVPGGRQSRGRTGCSGHGDHPGRRHRFDPAIPLLAGDIAYAVQSLVGGKYSVDIHDGGSDARRRLRRARAAAPALSGCGTDGTGAGRHRLRARDPPAAACRRAHRAAG